MQFAPIVSSSEGCAYLLNDGSESLLIDCGVALKFIMRATGFRASKLSGCLVSHSHGDHCKSVSRLAAIGVDVYASKETWSSLGVSGHRFKTLGHDNAVQVGKFLVKAFEVPHDCEGTLGFVIQGAKETLVYLTDAAYSKFTFPGVNILAVECNFDPEIMKANVANSRIAPKQFKRTVSTHMSLPRLLEMLRKNKEDGNFSGLREVWLLHLSDANSNEKDFKESVQRIVGCEVYVAEKRSSFTQGAVS